jgi:uncharacterized sulfatase
VPAQKYNVVFILTDTQRYDMIACNGSPWIHTPCLDRFAATACNFSYAYTASPVCTPARAALFTGLYPSSSGADANEKNVYRHVKFLGEHTAAAGIRSALIGKWHVHGEYDYYGSGQPDGGFMPEYWYDGETFRRDVGEEAFKRWKKGDVKEDSECWGGRVAHRASQFLERYAKEQFFLALCFDEPHSPFTAPPQYAKMYEGTTRPWQANMGDRLENKPAAHRAKREMWDSGGYVPDNTNPNNFARFYGCNTFVDRQIGNVIEAVERFCPDNTVIIVTSDHGDHAGAHTLTSKGNTMYEEATRIPLIIRAPGLTRAGSRCEKLISHIDLPPTMFALMGLEIPGCFQGRNALSLLQDPESAFQDEIFMEFTRFGILHHNCWGFMPIRCIRSRDYKLVLNLCDMDEFYDLKSDPGEITNRVSDAILSSVRNELHDRLLAWMNSRHDPLRGEGWYARPWRPDFHLDPKGKVESLPNRSYPR